MVLVAVMLLAGLAWPPPMPTDHPPDEVPTSATPVVPHFDVEARRGVVVLRGHTRSRRHEERLIRVARESFTGLQTRVEFTPLGIAPDWWSDATTELVSTLSTLHSPTARLRDDRLRIEALAANGTLAETRLRSLRQVLPESVSLSIAIASSGTASDVGALCARAFAQFDHGSIGFGESEAVLLSSAYPVLDRVVVLADACRDSTISITGHTDSSGTDAWNRQLSLARANAVADYLATRGVGRGRIAATGAGSSSPIADNATRYGRSLNRRIDIHFSSTD